MQKPDGTMEMMNEKNLVDVARMEANPSITFKVGERVNIKDGNFRIKSIGRKMMILEGVPGTRIHVE